MVPGDEILDYLSIDDSRYSSSADPLEQRKAYTSVAHKRGLDLPLFYLTVLPGYYPDGLYQIVHHEDRKAVENWIQSSKNKEGSMQLYNDLLKGLSYACPNADTSALANQFCQRIHETLHSKDLFSAHHNIVRLQTDIQAFANSQQAYTVILNELNRDIEQLIQAPKANYLQLNGCQPYNGMEHNNQYHQWMNGFHHIQATDFADRWKKCMVQDF